MAITKEQGTQKGILIKCHGMYYYKTEQTKGTKAYELEVRAPSLDFFREAARKYKGVDAQGRPIFEDRSYINPRGQLKKRLLPILLSKKYPDFARVKYVVIEEIIPEGNQKLDLPLTLRSRKQLAQLVADQRIPIDPTDYLDIDDLRTDIIEYQEDPGMFAQNKERKDKRRSEERQFIEMNNLNETLPPTRKTQGGIADL